MNSSEIISVNRAAVKDAKFSIIIPTWNNLKYLQNCISSINKNSVYAHQIIVHINEGSDGTKEWIEKQTEIDYSYSKSNIGVCYALNNCRALMKTDYVLYMNDDMYVCPEWDKHLMDEIKSIGHNYFFISATMIEPTAQTNCAIEKNYGTDINQFEEEKLLKEFSSLPMNDWSGATWPPNIVHKSVWDLVGGYSIEFSPGMYSDPDFSKKLWMAGVRYFKGISKSRVYHFGSKSVRRVKKNKGYYTFINKWGMTSRTFTNLYLKRGERFTGYLENPKIGFVIKIKSFYKRVIALFYS